MGWRSVVINNPASLDFHHNALRIEQSGQVAQVPLEDISVLVIDNPQVTLTAYLLSACADAQIAVLTVGADHHPNGVLLPFLPHSRALKVMRAQLAQSLPAQKRAWQTIVRQKIRNQAAVLACHRTGSPFDSRTLIAMCDAVRSGDADNMEAQAAQRYFRTLWGLDFNRNQLRFYNAALNYGYAVIRAALARNLCSYGFLPAFGLHHRSEQNAFNLADDLIEPYRPLIDTHILSAWPREPEREMTPSDKHHLVSLLHQGATLTQQFAPQAYNTVLAAIESTVISLAQWLENDDPNHLALPCVGTMPTDASNEPEEEDG